MSKQLASVLRAAAKQLLLPTNKYRWTSITQCNCGVVAKIACNLNDDELHDKLKDCVIGVWDGMAVDEFQKCDVTGLPVNQVFRVLALLGLTPKDIRDLEALRDPAIRRAAGLKRHSESSNDYCTPVAVAAYMRAWADMIDKPLKQPRRSKGRSQ